MFGSESRIRGRLLDSSGVHAQLKLRVSKMLGLGALTDGKLLGHTMEA